MPATLTSAAARLVERRSIAAGFAAVLAATTRGLWTIGTRPADGLSDQLLADIGLSRALLVVDALPQACGLRN